MLNKKQLKNVEIVANVVVAICILWIGLFSAGALVGIFNFYSAEIKPIDLNFEIKLIECVLNFPFPLALLAVLISVVTQFIRKDFNCILLFLAISGILGTPLCAFVIWKHSIGMLGGELLWSDLWWII